MISFVICFIIRSLIVPICIKIILTLKFDNLSIFPRDKYSTTDNYSFTQNTYTKIRIF